MTGSVERIIPEKGFAFILRDGERYADVFLSYTQMPSSEDFYRLSVGDRVAFDLLECPKGLRAQHAAAL